MSDNIESFLKKLIDKKMPNASKEEKEKQLKQMQKSRKKARD